MFIIPKGASLYSYSYIYELYDFNKLMNSNFWKGRMLIFIYFASFLAFCKYPFHLFYIIYVYMIFVSDISIFILCTTMISNVSQDSSFITLRIFQYTRNYELCASNLVSLFLKLSRALKHKLQRT